MVYLNGYNGTLSLSMGSHSCLSYWVVVRLAWHSCDTISSPALTAMPRRSKRDLGVEAALLLDTQESALMRSSHIRLFIIVLVALAFLGWAIPTAANFVIEYNWWKEVSQVDTWVSMLWYSITALQRQ